MRRVAIRILNLIKDEPLKLEEIANRLNKSKSWISNVVGDLQNENLVEKNKETKLSNTYEAATLAKLMESYKVEKILTGKREEILKSLLEGDKPAEELESEGFPKSTVYSALKDLKSAGVVAKKDKKYGITDDILRDFLKARKSPDRAGYSADGERVLILENGDEEGRMTAFSAFDRYGIGYYPVKTYLYRGGREPGPEDVLAHAVLCAENKKQMSMCGVFYLKNKAHLEPGRMWKLSRKWKCTERWADLLAYLDRRDVKRNDLFLPWEEFVQTAEEYGISPRGKHRQDRLLESLKNVGERLDNEVKAYLIGGANLILRGLKDATKDIDLVLESTKDFDALIEALKSLEYGEKVEIDRPYEELEPKAILERKSYPRWDVFVKEVGGTLWLTSGMKERSEDFEGTGKLNLRTVSPTDIFLFKAVTDRKGDLEDAALIARKETIDWREMFEEINEQERITERHPSFAVLDALGLLKERYDIDVPIRNRLASYCLENALTLTLKEPMTIKDLREEIDFPEHQIYNKLRKLEREGKVKVDRSEKLNRYERT